jgi:valyl-tRNA synthetase
MPFITEEIWSYLEMPNKLIRDHWPVSADRNEARSHTVHTASEKIESLKNMIRAIRNIRAEAGTARGKKIPVIVKMDAVSRMIYGSADEAHIKNLAGASSVLFTTNEADIPRNTVSAILKDAMVYVPEDELVDYSAERDRLEKEKTRLENDILRLRGKLANDGFTGKAPAQVVATERAKLESAEDALGKTIARLNGIREK